MRVHAGWFGLLAAVVAMTVQADVPNDPTEVKPLSVGVKAPSFEARATDGALRIFRPDGYQKPTVVIFYRGGWCPYCNMQLSDLRLVEQKLRQSGFEIVFLSTDRPEILYSSLKATDIHYTLLSDSHLEVLAAA
jgi:peroxiredoxin